MAISTLSAFWAVSILFVVTPGADWAYAMTAGLRHRSVVPAVSGLLLGHISATLLVAAGLAAVVASAPAVMPALTVLGAAYLAWLGFAMLATKPTTALDERAVPESSVRQAAKGIGVSGLNPKVILLFLALLPRFTTPQAAWPVPVQSVVLGIVHVASCAVVYFAVAKGAQALLGTRPTVAASITRFSGAAMILIGAGLLIETAVR